MPDILRIYGYYVENTAISFEYEVPALDEFTGRFEKIIKRFPWLVCEVDGALAGYAYADAAFERAAYQWDADISVYIDGKYHRRGIATVFYRCLEEFLTRQGYYHVYALITGSNKISLEFHKALGFDEIAVLRNSGYKFGEWHDVVWYDKALRQPAAEPRAPLAFSELDDREVEKILFDTMHRAN